MSKKLTLKDRHFISMYSRRLISTMKLRNVIDKFFEQIEPTAEEFKRFNITIDPKTFEFSCNDDEYTVEYEEFSPVVLEAMQKYIDMFDQEKAKKNDMLQRTFTYFRKIL